jgi:hypothetical protein
MVVTMDKKTTYVYISEGSIHNCYYSSYRFLPYIPENSIIIRKKRYIFKKLKIKTSPVFRNNMKKDKEYFIIKKN